MSKPRDDIELMQHFDGELPDELGELSADQRLKLQSLEQMSDVVRSHLELSADDVDAQLDGMWSNIERSISANGEARDAAVQSPRAPSPAPVRAAAEQDGGLFTAVGRWLDRYRSQVLTGAVCAATAAILVILLRDPKTVVKQRIVRVPAPVQVPVQVPVVSEPAVVESVSVEDGSATILTVPGEEGENSVKVIWITHDDMEGPI